MTEDRETLRATQCSRCGRPFVIAYRKRVGGTGKTREIPVTCPYEDCLRTILERFDRGVDLDSIRVRESRGSRSELAGTIR